jgi:hypothetical protein
MDMGGNPDSGSSSHYYTVVRGGNPTDADAELRMPRSGGGIFTPNGALLGILGNVIWAVAVLRHVYRTYASILAAQAYVMAVLEKTRRRQ